MRVRVCVRVRRPVCKNRLDCSWTGRCDIGRIGVCVRARIRVCVLARFHAWMHERLCVLCVVRVWVRVCVHVCVCVCVCLCLCGCKLRSMLHKQLYILLQVFFHCCCCCSSCCCESAIPCLFVPRNHQLCQNSLAVIGTCLRVIYRTRRELDLLTGWERAQPSMGIQECVV